MDGFRELPAGKILYNGTYIIERVLGTGGFGITYYAKHATLNKYYAIKEFFISGSCVRNTQTKKIHLQGISKEEYDDYKRKFMDEARTLSQLEHPNIAEVNNYFEENDTAYMVMKFIKGVTLQQLVMQRGKLDYDIALNYIAQISEAVGYIHEREILHRDIKPENIIITPDHRAILIDFGSAREFVHDKTQSHTIMLTKGYAPPEQYSSTCKKGSYSDIYSLGAVFYFMLTAQKPIDSSVRTIETLPQPKELSPSISENANHAIMKAMSLKPEDRHQTVDEFMADLLREKHPELTTENRDVKKSRKWLWITLAAVLMLTVSGIIVKLIVDNNTKKAEQQKISKQFAEQQEISKQFEEVKKLIDLEIVYWGNQDYSASSYHLFHNCDSLVNSSDIVEGSIERAFNSNKKYLCQECKNKVTDYNRYQSDIEKFCKMERPSFFNSALNYCDTVLKMRPDNKIVIEKKQKIIDERK